MTWHIFHLLPAVVCGLGGIVCAHEAAFNMRLGDNTQAVSNGIASCACWIAAAVSLAGAVS